jgi:hypothetical protein
LSYTPLSSTGFKGLRLDADPQDLGLSGAIDLKNVEFDQNGTVRARPGYDQVLATTTAGANWLEIIPENTPAGGSTDSRLVVLGTDYRLVNGLTHANIGSVSLTIGATPGTQYGDRLYWIDLLTNVFYYDVSAAAVASTALPSSSTRYLASDRLERRLLAADSTTVYFTAPGTYTFAGASSLQLLESGDGEITAMVPWDNDVYVLTTGRLFVLSGTTTTATGDALYNYRVIDTPVGCNYQYAACAARDGVYFVAESGVYRTTGGPPVLVSQALQPLFDGRSNSFFSAVSGPLGDPNTEYWRLRSAGDRLYFWKRGTAHVFMYDTRNGEWTYWNFGVAVQDICPNPNTGSDAREFYFINATGQLYKFGPDYADDDGTAIASSYQTGFMTISDGSKARVRGVHLTGTGTVSHATAVDLGAVGTSASVTLGNPGYDMRSAQGRDVSLRLSATSGAWSVSKWTGLVAGARGVR